MEIRSREHGALCAIRLRRAARSPNTAAGDGICADFEVVSYGLGATHAHTLYARSDLHRFIRGLNQFAAARTGEVLLRTAQPDLTHLRGISPLLHAYQEETPPRFEATLRILSLDRARHIALEVRLVRRHDIQTTLVEDSFVVTFELDPSSLAQVSADLGGELANLNP